MNCLLCLEDKPCVKAYLCDAAPACRNYLCSRCASTRISDSQRCSICREQGTRLVDLPRKPKHVRVLAELAADAKNEMTSWRTMDRRAYDRKQLEAFMNAVSTTAMYKGAHTASACAVDIVLSSLLQALGVLCDPRGGDSNTGGGARDLSWRLWSILGKHRECFMHAL
nr:hypothetical protein TetV2_00367 [Oceanusvirus sp.]